MGRFSVDWLTLREPFDHSARSRSILEPLRARLGEDYVGLELACGTGSGVRWLQHHLPGGRWTLVDHDSVLLAKVPPGLGVTLEHDLQDLPALDLPADLIACQALLDLVSEDWLLRFADWMAVRKVPLLATLSVDGRVEWSTATPEDERIQDAFRAHQLTDRGFGPSPGTRAPVVLQELLEARGFDVSLKEADWVIPSDAHQMLTEMVIGAAQAAGEMLGMDAVADWRLSQLEKVEAGTLSLRVGHLDLCAIPSR